MRHVTVHTTSLWRWNKFHRFGVDVWSLGVILYTLVYGAMPFESNDLTTLKRQISEGDYAQPSKPSDAAGLIRHMLTVTPARRATMEDALRHWWINFGYSYMPNDVPYSVDEEPPTSSARRDHPVVIHHRTQSSISSDSDLEADFRPSRWSRRKMALDSAGNSISSSMASSPAPLGEVKHSDDSLQETNPAIIASGLMKLSPELFEILKGCSSKSLAALLHPENVNDSSNSSHKTLNPTCQTEETRSENSDKTMPSSSTVFDSERKPPRGILKRRGKFSGGDSGCIMHEDGSSKSDDASIPKSGHLPRRLPSFREEAHGIFSSKHKASQLLDNGKSETVNSLPQPTLSVSSPVIHRRPEEQHSLSKPPSSSSLSSFTDIHQPVTYIASLPKSTNHGLTAVDNTPRTFSSLSLPTGMDLSIHPGQPVTADKPSPSSDSPDGSGCKNNSKVVRRPKSILKNNKGQAEDARNRLSISSVGSNSSADILDLSYDSGDSDHYVNQISPTKSTDGDICSPTQEIFDTVHLDRDLSHLTVKSFSSPQLYPRHRRSLSDECRKINLESALTYAFPRDTENLR
ncbi:hypothetical protein Btru_020190 [Bulinus truncatus]|nr:hypothetical protein Btru_020190 [Bulinus truncatus]